VQHGLGIYLCIVASANNFKIRVDGYVDKEAIEFASSIGISAFSCLLLIIPGSVSSILSRLMSLDEAGL